MRSCFRTEERVREMLNLDEVGICAGLEIGYLQHLPETSFLFMSVSCPCPDGGVRIDCAEVERRIWAPELEDSSAKLCWFCRFSLGLRLPCCFPPSV